jgi:tricorn protease
VRIDPPERDSPVETITIDNIADAFDLSPSAKRAAISARGRIFTIATEQGEVRRVTDTMAHDRMPRWSPDGKWIAFLSDRSGRDEVWISEERGSTTRKLTDLEGEKFGLVWAKDAKSVFCIVEEKLYRIATETGRQELIGKGDLDLTSPQVSPDGTWIAWAATTQDSMVRIFVKPLAGGEVHQVYQRGYVRASQPQWSPNGKKLLFLASNAGAVDTWQNTLFALTLQKEDKDPNYKGVDEEPEFVPDTPPATPPATASSTKTARNVEVKIDWDGMDRRMRQVTRLSDSINTYAVSPDSRAYVIVAAGQLYAIDDDGGRSTRLTQPTAGAPDAAPGEGGPPTGLQFSRDGRTVFFREGTAIYSASTASPQAGAAAPTKKKLTFTVRATADSRLQRHFVFNEACRMIQDHYYDRKLNGLDWDAVRRQYEPLLEFVDDQEGLADLLRQMIGELNTSHTGATAPVQPGAPRAGSGHPGFDLAPDSSGYYRVTHILKNGPADKDYVKLQKGDYLLAVNDQSLKSGDNYWKAFRGGPGRTLELTVNSKPAMDGSWRIRISPAGDSRTLYYDEWVAERKAQVDKLSGGEIGYIHLRIMTPDIMPQFEAELYEYRLKKGLILDVRFNGGGNLEMQLLKDLASRHYMSLISSKGIEFPRPARGFSGSIVVLQNENSGSNAEMFPEAVRAAGLGKLVGMPTPGMVLLSSDFALSDGTHLAIGHGHIQTLRGENMENNGVQPDVLVDNLPADVATGRDAQLEKAVEVLRGIR